VPKAFAPFTWSTRPTESLAEIQTAWLEQERSRGILAGMAVPIQDSGEGPAYLSFFGYDEAASADLVARQAPDLAFAAAQFHARAKALVKPADWAPSLSKREIQVLRLAALGKTYEESAEALGVSHRTVEYHLRRASEKLGAVTKIRAVVLAFGMGLAGI
jgi:LuxR family transcriptional regulator, activator of conjugal transfer of Ti plasmids